FAFTTPLNAGIITGVGGFALAGGFYLLARLFARRQIRRLGSAFGVYHAESARAVRLLNEYAHKAFERAKADLIRRHANDRKQTDDHFLPLLAQILKAKEAEFETIESEHDDKTNQITADRQTETRAADAAHDRKLKEIAAKHDAEAK